MPDGVPAVDFFVSHAGRDRAWAEWVAAQLRSSGYVVELDTTDWAAGENFMQRIGEGLARCRAVVALWSGAYFVPGSYCLRELTAADLARVRIIPVRIEDFDPPPLWRHLIYRDIFGSDAQRARRTLLDAVTGRAATDATVPLPAGVTPRRPGSLPPIWNVPSRTVPFGGREALLSKVRDMLLGTRNPSVIALHGLGGVGKTQTVIEYAYRFSSEYDLVWWVNAERSSLIAEQVSGLAFALDVARDRTGIPAAVDAARAYLRAHDRWLIVFDNVNTSVDLRGWIPAGRGHVVITSRSHTWTGMASPIVVDVFDRAESVALLSAQFPQIAPIEANSLADQLGDLPLALTQAAGFMIESGTSPENYLRILGSMPSVAMDAAVPNNYELSLTATVRLAMDRLYSVDSVAAHLARLCAWLGPEPIPSWLWIAGALPTELAAVESSPIVLGQRLGKIARYGLAQMEPESITMHRLTQLVIRASQTPAQQETDRRAVEKLLGAAEPGDTREPKTWPRWAQLRPHIAAVDPGTSSIDMMNLAIRSLYQLFYRGDYSAAVPIAEELYSSWRRRTDDDDPRIISAALALSAMLFGVGDYERCRELDEDTLARCRRILGENDPDTLRSASYLAADLQSLGEYESARRLDEDALARRRRVLGDDHPDTLRSANSLAVDLHRLGKYELARELNEDTLIRRRRVLGDDHPDTLTSTGNLAATLLALGEHEPARQLNEDTLARRRRVLGDDHPDTLTSTGNLAVTLLALGKHELARELNEDTLARRRRVLGDDHPDTLTSVSNLAATLLALGEHEPARQLHEDAVARRSYPVGDGLVLRV